MIDLFQAKLELPETVYVLGSGIRGTEHHARIPPDACVIALNKAYKVRPPALWMVWAKAYVREDWFIAAMQSDTTKAFGTPLLKYMTLHKMDWSKVNYGFNFLPQWHEHPPRQMINGILRTGGTIAGAAVQLCYWKNVKHIILCGIDMWGHSHFDGTRGSQPGGRDGKLAPDGSDLPWLHDARGLTEMIRICERNGMTVQTLSETYLEVERI